MTDIATRYGVTETNPLPDDYDHGNRRDVTLRELAAAGGRITRVRLLTEVRPGYGRIADVSYVHGIVLAGDDSYAVRVTDYPATNLLKDVGGDFIAWGKGSGVFAKAVGLLDRTLWSVLY
jgi:hypothetical protein